MLRLQDIMTRDVVALDPEMSLRDALDVLTVRQISGAPVIEGDKVVGVWLRSRHPRMRELQPMRCSARTRTACS